MQSSCLSCFQPECCCSYNCLTACTCTPATDCDLESECVTMSHLERLKKKSRSITRPHTNKKGRARFTNSPLSTENVVCFEFEHVNAFFPMRGKRHSLCLYLTLSLSHLHPSLSPHSLSFLYLHIFILSLLTLSICCFSLLPFSLLFIITIFFLSSTSIFTFSIFSYIYLYTTKPEFSMFMQFFMQETRSDSSTSFDILARANCET